MKKYLPGIVITALMVVVLGTTGYVYAQSSTPPAPAADSGTNEISPTPAPWGGMGRGARGMMRGQNADTDTQYGPLHEKMIEVYAQKLGLSVEELNSRLTKGETMAQIVFATGLTEEQFRTLMTEVRSQAIDQAVKDGTLTQEQADWMKQRSTGMVGGGRGMRGGGRGQNANPTCPYFPQP